MNTHELPDLRMALRVLASRPQGKSFPGMGYPLAGGQFGRDIAIPDTIEADESRMSIVIPFADGNNRDGVGDVLEVGGIRTDRHQKNPFVLYDHGKQVTLPIALSEDPDTKGYTVSLDPSQQRARGNAFFYQGKSNHAEFCEQLYDLMVKGFVRGGSIGYTVIAARELPADYQNGTPQGLHLMSVMMLEYSSVVLPANKDTVIAKYKGFDWYMSRLADQAREILCMRGVCGKPLPGHFRKSLSAYADLIPTKVKSGYAQHTPSGYRWEFNERPQTEDTLRTFDRTAEAYDVERNDEPYGVDASVVLPDPPRLPGKGLKGRKMALDPTVQVGDRVRVRSLPGNFRGYPGQLEQAEARGEYDPKTQRGNDEHYGTVSHVNPKQYQGMVEYSRDGDGYTSGAYGDVQDIVKVPSKGQKAGGDPGTQSGGEGRRGTNYVRMVTPSGVAHTTVNGGQTHFREYVGSTDRQRLAAEMGPSGGELVEVPSHTPGKSHKMALDPTVQVGDRVKVDYTPEEAAEHRMGNDAFGERIREPGGERHIQAEYGVVDEIGPNAVTYYRNGVGHPRSAGIATNNITPAPKGMKSPQPHDPRATAQHTRHGWVYGNRPQRNSPVTRPVTEDESNHIDHRLAVSPHLSHRDDVIEALGLTYDDPYEVMQDEQPSHNEQNGQKASITTAEAMTAPDFPEDLPLNENVIQRSRNTAPMSNFRYANTDYMQQGTQGSPQRYHSSEQETQLQRDVSHQNVNDPDRAHHFVDRRAGADDGTQAAKPGVREALRRQGVDLSKSQNSRKAIRSDVQVGQQVVARVPSHAAGLYAGHVNHTDDNGQVVEERRQTGSEALDRTQVTGQLLDVRPSGYGPQEAYIEGSHRDHFLDDDAWDIKPADGHAGQKARRKPAPVDPEQERRNRESHQQLGEVLRRSYEERHAYGPPKPLPVAPDEPEEPDPDDYNQSHRRPRPGEEVHVHDGAGPNGTDYYGRGRIVMEGQGGDHSLMVHNPPPHGSPAIAHLPNEAFRNVKDDRYYGNSLKGVKSDDVPKGRRNIAEERDQARRNVEQYRPGVQNRNQFVTSNTPDGGLVDREYRNHSVDPNAPMSVIAATEGAATGVNRVLDRERELGRPNPRVYSDSIGSDSYRDARDSTVEAEGRAFRAQVDKEHEEQYGKDLAVQALQIKDLVKAVGHVVGAVKARHRRPDVGERVHIDGGTNKGERGEVYDALLLQPNPDWSWIQGQHLPLIGSPEDDAHLKDESGQSYGPQTPTKGVRVRTAADTLSQALPPAEVAGIDQHRANSGLGAGFERRPSDGDVHGGPRQPRVDLVPDPVDEAEDKAMHDDGGLPQIGAQIHQPGEAVTVSGYYGTHEGPSETPGRSVVHLDMRDGRGPQRAVVQTRHVERRKGMKAQSEPDNGWGAGKPYAITEDELTRFRNEGPSARDVTSKVDRQSGEWYRALDQARRFHGPSNDLGLEDLSKSLDAMTVQASQIDDLAKALEVLSGAKAADFIDIYNDAPNGVRHRVYSNQNAVPVGDPNASFHDKYGTIPQNDRVVTTESANNTIASKPWGDLVHVQDNRSKGQKASRQLEVFNDTDNGNVRRDVYFANDNHNRRNPTQSYSQTYGDEPGFSQTLTPDAAQASVDQIRGIHRLVGTHSDFAEDQLDVRDNRKKALRNKYRAKGVKTGESTPAPEPPAPGTSAGGEVGYVKRQKQR